MKSKRVVITGMGALTPIGNTVEAYWEGLSSGTSGANLITRFDTSLFKTKFACEIKGFDALDHFDRKAARKLDRFAQYGMVAAREALTDSGLELDKLDLTRFGVVMGSGIGGIEVFTDQIQDIVKLGGNPRFNPFFIPKMIINIVAGQISIEHGLRGPSYSSVSACATSTHCIIDAYMHIQMGFADYMVAGGSEAAVSISGVGGFNAMKALSENNEEFASASRPFDKRRDGFVLGEGAGALILETYESAKARGAQIYAEIVGIGMNSDAYHVTAPDPEGKGVAKVMTDTLAFAGLETTDVDYINVHGTSTPLGDKHESSAIKKVFGDHAHKLNISSSKSMTGHLLGAAGAIETIAGVLAIKHQVVPPTINYEVPDPDCDLNYTPNEAVSRDVNVVISNTFGFGGHNATLALKRVLD